MGVWETQGHSAKEGSSASMSLKQCDLHASEESEPLPLCLSAIRALRSPKIWLPPWLGHLSCAIGRGRPGRLVKIRISGSLFCLPKGFGIGGIVDHEGVKSDMLQLILGQNKKGAGGQP